MISTSKIRKIIAIKKNWMENGRRAEDLGSNPHSKGLLFSRSENLFFDVKFRIKMIKNLIVAIMKAIIDKNVIIHTKFY